MDSWPGVHLGCVYCLRWDWGYKIWKTFIKLYPLARYLESKRSIEEKIPFSFTMSLWPCAGINWTCPQTSDGGQVDRTYVCLKLIHAWSIWGLHLFGGRHERFRFLHRYMPFSALISSSTYPTGDGTMIKNSFEATAELQVYLSSFN